MANNRSLIELHHDILKYALPRAVTKNKEVTQFKGLLSKTCKHFSTLFKPDLTEAAIITLLQAVIDDNGKTARRILDSWPEILLEKTPKNYIIESQLTWQRFNIIDEDALSIAVKLKRVKMIELLCPYYDEVKFNMPCAMTNKADALAKWKNFDRDSNHIIPIILKKYHILTEHTNYLQFTHSLKKIFASKIIPPEYRFYLQSLINIFTREDCQNGQTEQLSDEAEEALHLLFNLLLPKHAVKLDDYLDAELFLIAAVLMYGKNYDTFQNINQRYAFCVRVIGLIESVMSPEIAKMICKYENCDDAPEEMLNFENGDFFYRSSRDCQKGLGYKYFCLSWGKCPMHNISPLFNELFLGHLTRIYGEKIRNFANILQQPEPHHTQSYEILKHS